MTNTGVRDPKDVTRNKKTYDRQQYPHLIAELVVDQRLRAKRPEIHGLIKPDAVVIDVDL